MPVDCRKVGWLGVVTQEMRKGGQAKDTCVDCCNLLCRSIVHPVLAAPCHMANVCCIPQTPLPAGFLLGSAVGRSGWMRGD